MTGARLSHINSTKCARELREEFVQSRIPIEIPENRRERAGKVRFIR